VSVKMNALLFAPALALLMLRAARTRTIIAAVALALGLQARAPYAGSTGARVLCTHTDVRVLRDAWLPQVALGAPFLAEHPREYVSRAFDFGRRFEQRWSVNLQFLPEHVFLSRATATALLAVHLALLAGACLHYCGLCFMYTVCRSAGQRIASCAAGRRLT
jgi:hypothetical protein